MTSSFLKMCGILGAFGLKTNAQTPVRTLFYEAFVEALFRVEHRGPDGFGFWCSGSSAISKGALLFSATDPTERVKEETVSYFQRNQSQNSDRPNVLFGHRRLTIIDLSEAASQPMGAQSKHAKTPDLWLTYNGEVYNYIELRDDLKKRGFRFETQSDSEVILKAYEEFGTDCFAEFNGMWGLGLWDERRQQLVLSRDRMGVKPLYYTIAADHFVFASEIKQLLLIRKKMGLENRWNNYRMYEFLSQSLQHHSEETLYADIYQLPPAHLLTLNPMDSLSIQHLRAKTKAYWSFPSEFKIRSSSEPSFEEAALKLSNLLKSSVQLRLRSDVPVGSALSGGLDSSGIVSIVSKLNPLSQKTFSAIYEGENINEQRFAESVIQKISTEGRKVEAHWVRPNSENLAEHFSRLVDAQDGPFPSTSMYPQWEVFRLARENGVVVMLDGQGADEIMGGYEGFFKSHVKSVAKNEGLFQAALQGFQFIQNHPGYYSLSRFAKKMATTHEFEKMFSNAARAEIESRRNEFNQSGDVYRFGSLDRVYSDPLKEALYRATVCTSLPALLMYEDRNSMNSSIESRTPYLDYRIVEFAFSCPSEYHVRSGERKALLRSALKGIVPEDVRLRKDKLGYSTPEVKWRNSFPVKNLEVDSQVFNQDRLLGLASGPGFWKVLGVSLSQELFL